MKREEKNIEKKVADELGIKMNMVYMREHK